MTAPIATAEHAAARRFTVRTGRPHPLGATPDAEGANFALFTRHATSVELLLFERHDSPKPVKTIQLDPSVNRTFYFWHIYVNGVTPGMCYAYRVDGPGDLHGAGHRFNPNKVLIDPYGRGTTSTLWDRVAACGPDDNLTKSLRSVVIDMTDYDWEGDEPLRQVDAGHGHLRDARARLHQVADLGRAEPRDLPRGHREDPVPPEAGRDRRRAAAGLRVRRGRDQRHQPAHRPATHQLLGLQPDQLLQPARGLLRRARRGLPRPRVPGHGQGLPQGRHRGHPRRRLQPHRRRQPRGPDDQLPGPRQPGLLPPRALRQAVLHEPVGLREHVQLQRPAGREVHRRVPALLGPRDARRRLPLRPRVDPVARPGRQPDGRPAGPLAYRARQRAVRHEDHRRGLGRRRALPGRLLPRFPLGRVERALPRRRPALGQGRQGHGLQDRRADRRQRRHLPGRRRAADQQHQLHHRTRRLHAQRPGLVRRQAQRGQRRGQPRRHRRQPELEPWRRGRHGRPRDRGPALTPGPQLPDHPDAVPGCPDDGHGRRGAADPVRQQQRLLPGQRDHLVRLEARRRARRPDPFHQRADRLPEGAFDAAPLALLHRRAQRARPGRHLVARLPHLLAGLGRPRLAGPRLHPGRLPDPGQQQVGATPTSTS